MAIYKGNQIIKRLYKGETPVRAVFKGGQIVHPDMLVDMPEKQSGYIIQHNRYQVALRYGNLYSGSTFATPWVGEQGFHGFTINKSGIYHARYYTEIKALADSGSYVKVGWAKVNFGTEGQILGFTTLSESVIYYVHTSYVNVQDDNPNFTHTLNAGDVVMPYVSGGSNVMEQNAIAGLVFYG